MRTNPVTARYNVTTDEAAQEWIVALPSGDGSYRLHTPPTPSEANRAVFVAMYHELHCIQTFAVALVENTREQWPHFRHCLNYIRQMAMCRPDLTVEAGRFVDEQFVGAAPGAVHVCQDWRIPPRFPRYTYAVGGLRREISFEYLNVATIECLTNIVDLGDCT